MLCKLTTNVFFLFVYIIILALLHPAVIQCGIMVKINYKLVVVFEEYLSLLLNDIQALGILFMEAGICFSLKILSFKGHIKFQTCFSAS